jgi:hypothetical protein
MWLSSVTLVTTAAAAASCLSTAASAFQSSSTTPTKHGGWQTGWITTSRLSERQRPKQLVAHSLSSFSPLLAVVGVTAPSDDDTTTANNEATTTMVDDDTSTTSLPLSAFGTKEYWDDVYTGRGDFDAHEYSWYYGWNELKRYIGPYLHTQLNNPTGPDTTNNGLAILLPGIGNDPLLTDLIKAGYSTGKGRRLTAQDYSQHAIDRQRDLLDYCGYTDTDENCSIELSCSNVKNLPVEWRASFDVILEKGLLDAVYLSGNVENVRSAVASLTDTLKVGGIFVSVSGVVPDELRMRLFDAADDGGAWKWLRDGSQDLKAGCFIFQKL